VGRVEQAHGWFHRRGLTTDPFVEPEHLVDPRLVPFTPGRTGPQTFAHHQAVARERQVVDIADQHPFGDLLELDRHDSPAEHDRAAALVDHAHHSQPGRPEQLEVVVRVAQPGRPQHVLLQHDDLVAELSGQQTAHRRLARPAGTGQREHRQPQERLPMTALSADQNGLIGRDHGLVHPNAAAHADFQVHRCFDQSNNSSRKLLRLRLCP
jgi:hypothetical protein